MSKIEQFSRLLHHRITVGGQVFTVPTSNDHTDDTWLNTDLYIGEIGINVTSNTAYMRTNNGIIQLATGTSSSGSTSSTAGLWDYTGTAIRIGSTYSITDVSPRSGYFTDLGSATLPWKDLYLGGRSSGSSIINVNAGLQIIETGSQGILSSGYDPVNNTPIQIWGTASAIDKDRILHLNSRSSYSAPGNQKATIASNNVIDNSSNNSLVAGANVTVYTGVTQAVHLGQGYNKVNYESNMVVTSALAVRGIPDDGSTQYGRSDWTTKQASLRTSNASTTNLVSIAYDANGGELYQIKAFIVGSEISDSRLAYSVELTGTFTKSSSDSLAYEIGNQVQFPQNSFTGTAPDVVMYTDTNGIYIKVTGKASTTIQWLCTYSYHKLINITV